MFQKIRNAIITKILIDSFKRIEKQDFTTKALEICYKKKEVRLAWGIFTDSVIGLFEDAIDETKQAKGWKNN